MSHCRHQINPVVDLALYLSLTHEQDLKMLELFHPKQRLSSNPESATHLHLRLETTPKHIGGSMTKSSGESRDPLIMWFPIPDPIQSLAALRNSVHENGEEDQWQRAAIPESKEREPDSESHHTGTKQLFLPLIKKKKQLRARIKTTCNHLVDTTGCHILLPCHTKQKRRWAKHPAGPKPMMLS